MTIRFLRDGMRSSFESALYRSKTHIRIISPFISGSVTEIVTGVLQKKPGLTCTIITRFYMTDFISGASDLNSLEALLQAGATIYALNDLHAKLYLFDQHSVLTGSTNFTAGGFYRNHEFDVFMENEPAFAEECLHYFTDLVTKIKADGDWRITQSLINEAKAKVNKAQAGVSPKEKQDKPWGANILPGKGKSNSGGVKSVEEVLRSDKTTGVWLKFEGSRKEPADGSKTYMERKQGNYPSADLTYFGLMPRQLKIGHIVFIGTVIADKIAIVGYAEVAREGMAENGGGVHTTSGQSYPFSIQFQNGKFLKAPIEKGIPLMEVCEELGADLYPSGFTDVEQVKRVHSRHSHVQITAIAQAYLIDRLEQLFGIYGFDSF